MGRGWNLEQLGWGWPLEEDGDGLEEGFTAYGN